MKQVRSYIKQFGALWQRYWFSPEPVIGLALFRVAFGASVLIYHLPRFPYIADLYTPIGFMAPQNWISWLPSIRPLSPLAAYAANILLLAAILALMFGYRTRLAAFLTFAIHSYLILVEYLVADGLSQIIAIFSLLLAFSPAGEYFSLDAWKKLGTPAPDPLPRRPGTLSQIMIWQLALIYIATAMAKIVHGFRDWVSGDIIIWLFQNTQWSQPWVWPLAIRFEGSLRLATEVFFFAFLLLGIGLLWRRTRPWAAAFGLLWHLIIFATTIISPGWLALVSVYLLLIEPATWERSWMQLRERRMPASRLALGSGLVMLFIIAATYGRGFP